MNKTNDYDKYDDFIRQYEDTQGSFILESFDSDDIEWLKYAKRK